MPFVCVANQQYRVSSIDETAYIGSTFYAPQIFRQFTFVYRFYFYSLQ